MGSGATPWLSAPAAQAGWLPGCWGDPARSTHHQLCHITTSQLSGNQHDVSEPRPEAAPWVGATLKPKGQILEPYILLNAQHRLSMCVR